MDGCLHYSFKGSSGRREYLYSFDELGIKEEPYVEEFKDKYGFWPVLNLRTIVKLPVRNGTHYRMQSYRLHDKFQVVGMETGKKFPFNIVAHRLDLKEEIVITPPFMVKNFEVFHTAALKIEDITEYDQVEEIPTPIPPAPAKVTFESILERRRKEAVYLIDLILF